MKIRSKLFLIILPLLLSSILIIGLGWYITDKIVEPRLRGTALDGEETEVADVHELAPEERRGLWAGLAAMAAGVGAAL